MAELKPITEMQQKLVSALFNEEYMQYSPRDRIRAAMRYAGYSDNTMPSDILPGLKDHIIEATKNYLVYHGPNAAMTMVEVMGNPGEGSRDMLNAAKEILDRGAGIIKVDKMEIEAPNHGIFILPVKEDEDDE